MPVVLDLTSTDPRRVGPFKLVGRLGAGGMGLVYAGQDSTGRRAAIKVVQPQLAHDTAFRARFAREAVLLGRVDGACTARVLAADVDADPPYVALEYVEGPTLAEFVEASGPLPQPLLMPLAVGLAEALSAIHQAGVVHRDLKPANVILSATGPKVIDFGIAYLADATSITISGLVLGSPGWMAPEQFTADVVSPASDVFAWASTVLFAVTGRAPFGGGTVQAVFYRIVNVDPDLTDVPEPLRSALDRAFNKDPVGRPTPVQLVELLSGVPTTDVAAHTTALLRNTWTLRTPTDVWQASTRETPSPSTMEVSAAGSAAAGPPPRRRRKAVVIPVASLVVAMAIVGGVYAVGQDRTTAGPSPLAGITSTPTALHPSRTPTAGAGPRPSIKAAPPPPRTRSAVPGQAPWARPATFGRGRVAPVVLDHWHSGGGFPGCDLYAPVDFEVGVVVLTSFGGSSGIPTFFANWPDASLSIIPPVAQSGYSNSYELRPSSTLADGTRVYRSTDTSGANYNDLLLAIPGQRCLVSIAATNHAAFGNLYASLRKIRSP